jgi:hypothetical protein
MENRPVYFDIKKTGKDVADFVRARAIKAGSHVIYIENGQLIEEDPRTGIKVIIKSA